MAKAPAAAPQASSMVGNVKIETGVSLPPVTRGFGASKEPNPYIEVLDKMQVSADPNKLQSFFIEAKAPDSITDPGEKTKAANEEARKTANRMSGLIRRLYGENTEKGFALRKVTENGKTGVRIFCVKPEAKS